MKENEWEKSLRDKVKRILDEDAESLDPSTVRALRGVRSEALDLSRRKAGFQIIPRWITAGGIATATVLVAAVSVFYISSAGWRIRKTKAEIFWNRNWKMNRERRKGTMAGRVGFIFVLMMMSWTASAMGEETGIHWKQLSSDQQQVLEPLRESWEQIPPARRERLSHGAECWGRMSPEERKAAEERLQRWHNYTPEQREVIRKRFEEFHKLPPEEQEKIRSRFKWFRQLPPEQRNTLREKWRGMSHEERRDLQQRWPTMSTEEKEKFMGR
jgi:hypothetical protein